VRQAGLAFNLYHTRIVNLMTKLGSIYRQPSQEPLFEPIHAEFAENIGSKKDTF
jgi:hypothetical protein